MRNKNMAAAAALAFVGTCGLPFMLHIEGDYLGYTNSAVSVFVFLFLFWLMKRILETGFYGNKKRWFLPGCFGLLFSLCMVFGAKLDVRGSVPFKEIGMWAAIAALAGIFTIVVRFFWDVLGAWGCRKPVEEERKRQEVSGKSLFIRAGIILLCYLPVFLAVYPGFFVYDAQDEYMQVVTRNFSTHHPLLHVLLLGGIIQLVYKLTGSYNLGIACYTFFQMTVMSFIFAWCVEKLKERGLGKAGRICLTLYFGLCPVLVMFSLCSAKDGLFTGMLLIMVLLLQDLCAEPEKFLPQIWKARKGQAEEKLNSGGWPGYGSGFLLAAASLLMMLLRHNGVYAFFVFAVILIFCLRRYFLQAVVYFGIIAILYAAVNSALTFGFGADDSENQEMLTVPISQMARVYADGKDGLAAEDKEVLYRYLSEEALERYTPKVSDGVKIHFNNEAFRTDKASFLKLWFKWGMEHPFTYLNAWFMTSYGFWYPDTVIDVYRGNSVFTYTYEDSSYFGYEVEEPGRRESKIPWLDELYRKMSLEIFQQKLPVVSMLFSPGFLFWVMAFGMGFLCYQGKGRKALPFLLPLLVWLTVILGPTYLVRYVVFLWVMAPLLVWEIQENYVKFDN
ncbi:MAG: hypothetical protein K2G19_11705 [Lachnospiraceae bacterium]|nr:hypothetical protein [Lachnospiraceae bacterium]